MSGEEYYETGQKKHWRRQVWNAIKAALLVPAGEARVIYLAAAQDHDRREALARGFHPRNLIAVDRDKDVVKALRSKGQAAICGDVFDVIESFREPLHVVHLDLMGGLYEATYKRMDHAFGVNLQLQKAVLAVNLLRGRDKLGGEIARAMKAQPGFPSAFDTNRAVFLHGLLWKPFFQHLERRVENELQRNGLSRVVFENATYRMIHKECKDAILSYRSPANQTFDTLVTRTVWQMYRCFYEHENVHNPAGVDEATRAHAMDTARKLQRDHVAMRGKVAAFKAVQTRYWGRHSEDVA